MQEIAEDKGFKVHLFECGEGDHVHCFVSAPPKLSITAIVKYLKGISGRKLFERFPEIRNQLWKGELWNKQLPSQTAQEVCKLLDKAWKSFYVLKRTGGIETPRPPRFKQESIPITYMQMGIYPPEKGNCKIIVVYEIPDQEELPQNGHELSIDLGLHNLMTCYDSGNGKTFILGRKYLAKLKRYGIRFIKQEESYTSQCSPLSPEVGKRYAEPSNRKERGLYRDGNRVYNADAVGAYNILRKYHSVSGVKKELSVTGLKTPEIIKVAV